MSVKTQCSSYWAETLYYINLRKEHGGSLELFARYIYMVTAHAKGGCILHKDGMWQRAGLSYTRSLITSLYVTFNVLLDRNFQQLLVSLLDRYLQQSTLSGQCQSEHSTAAIGAETLYSIDFEGTLWQSRALSSIYIHSSGTYQRWVDPSQWRSLTTSGAKQHPISDQIGSTWSLTISTCVAFRVLLDRYLQQHFYDKISSFYVHHERAKNVGNWLTMFCWRWSSRARKVT